MKYWYEYTKEELEQFPEKLPQNIIDAHNGKPPYKWNYILKMWIDVSLYE
jgi:hypothetical protein